MSSRSNSDADPRAEDPPPQVISPLMRRRLQECYEHSTRLMGQDSYDFAYAHTLLVECVGKDPGNHVYLEAFFANLQRKYRNNKRGALLRFGGKAKFKKAVAREAWDEVLRLGLERLQWNPWEVLTLRGMAAACGSLGYHETELRYLRNALEVKPKDAEVNRHCAHSLARLGQFDQAIACWQRVDEANKGDREAQEMIADLQIAKTQERRGLPESESARRVRRRRSVPPQADTEQTASSGQARREIPLTPRQQLEQAILQNPTDLEVYFQLADLHVSTDHHGEAAHVLSKALAASGNDPQVQERLEDVEILQKKKQLEVADRRARASRATEETGLADQLRDDLNRFELDVYNRRSERYPDDLEIQFELGLRLKRAGNARHALPLFERAGHLPQRTAAAALERGECLQRLKQYAQAMEQYQLALENARTDEQAEVLQRSLYRAAVLATALGNLRAAEQWLSELQEREPNYKDVASRLDKIRQLRHKG